MKIGVLALQGDFLEHISILERLRVKAISVRKLDELKDLDGLIFPGGESTAIASLMHSFNLFKSFKELVQTGLPIMGTCAGMILMAKKITCSNIPPLGFMDMEVKRNAFGRQVASFETELIIPTLGEKPFPAVFIRAPLILDTGPEVEILASLDSGTIVAARQGTKLAIAFHPELGSDLRLHRYFLEIVATHKLIVQDSIQTGANKINCKVPIAVD